MAIGKADQPTTVRSYWPRYWAKSVFIVVCMQIIAVLIVTVALLVAGVVDVINIYMWISIGAILVGVIAINILTISIVLEPLKQLAAAITHAAGEPSPLPPPNPNITRFEKTGLKPLLQTIYEQSGGEALAPPGGEDLHTTILDTALSHTSSGIVVYDAGRRIIYANAAAPVRQAEDGAKHVEVEFYTDQTLDAWLEECEQSTVRAEKTWTRIPSKPAGEEGRKVYDITASYEKGSEALAVVIFFEKTVEYAPEDNDLNFIAFAAHELRGPITVIRGYLDTLGDELTPVLSADQQELLGRLTVSANRLSGYINNILNTARYDRRHLKVHLRETRLIDIYSAIADDMNLRATSQRRLLSVAIPDNLPTIAADPTSLDEVLANLIDNAIKYSSEGGAIEVTAAATDSFVEVSVKDNGIGMPANVVSNLFHKFYRSHRSRETVAGTGIGLYIAKAIIESHGGTINARSVEGEGATFTFTVPTYASVADKLQQTGGDNAGIIKHGEKGWIRNHGSIRG